MRSIALLALALAYGCGGAPAKGSSTPRAEEEVELPDEAPVPVANALVREGEARLAAGDVQGAKKLFLEAIAKTPDDPRAHLDLGIVLEMEDDLEGAERAYRESLRLSPDLPEALNNLGLLLHGSGDLDEAVSLLRRAVELRRNFAEGWVNLALALEDAGDRKGAIAAWRRAVELSPKDPVVRANLGLALLGHGEREEAAVVLREARPLASGNAAALTAIGNGLRRAGDFDGAVSAMQDAIASHEDGPTPALLSELALAQHAAGLSKDAESTLERALALDANYATAHYLLGTILKARGAKAKATTHFQRYLRLEPNGPHAAKARAQLGGR